MRKAAVDGREIGWVWLSLPGTARPSMAWISNIEVEPEFRSRGYARSILEAIEEEARKLGVTRIGLNVFADNHPAIHLYERLGYRLLSQQRSRRLTEIPPAEGVELVPPAGCTTSTNLSRDSAWPTNCFQSSAVRSRDMHATIICRSELVAIRSPMNESLPGGCKMVSIITIRLPGFIAGTIFRMIRTAYLSDQSCNIHRMKYTSAATGCGVKKS